MDQDAAPARPYCMRLIERYLFRQFLGPTIAATLALGVVALLTQSLTFLDIIVDKHQSVLVFAKIVALSMPQMLSIVLPIALFVAALITLNRLHTEQEIVVCFAGGMSRWRVVSPFLRLAVFAALITLVTMLWVAPWAQRQRQEEIFKVKTDLLTSLVRAGSFTQTGKGLTVYAQSTDPNGVMSNIFIDETKDDGSSSSFNAKTGEIVVRGGKPAMVLHNGSNQQLSKLGNLNYLTFGEYVFDLTPYVTTEDVLAYKPSDKFLHELVKPDKTNPDDVRNKKKYLAEAHARLAAPLYDIAVVMLALAGVVGGAFSRTGYGARIAIVTAIALAMRILGFGAQAACNASTGLNFLQYLVPLIPAIVASRILFRRGPSARALTNLSPLTPTRLTPSAEAA
jgi:lipopolysaccharide export system permease protein